MIKRALIVLAVLFAATTAHAQGCGASNPNCVVATPAATDNSNRAANTAWVNLWAGSALPLATDKVWIGSAGGIATPQTFSGDGTLSVAGAFTLAAVNGNTGSFGSATQCTTFTANAKGLITAASQATCAPAIGSVTGLGTGVATALGLNIGSAGAPVVFNGAGGTPSSLTLTNATGLPNTGLVNSSTTVAGQTCALGASCLTAAQLQVFAGYPVILGGSATGVNLNALGDTAIAITNPGTKYRIFVWTVYNTGTTASLSAAQFGIFSATGGGGQPIVATGTALSAITATGINATNNDLSGNSVATIVNYSTLYFRVTQVQGAAATGSVYIWIQPIA